MFLKEYKKNFFSQNGEDGVLLEILNRLNLLHKKITGAVNLEHGMENMAAIFLIL